MVTFPQSGFDENMIPPYQPEGMQIFPAGEAMMAADGPILAYIAGSAEAFTSKDHSFLAGQTIQKQVAVLNDTRNPQNYAYSWKAMLGTTEIAHGQANGKSAAGEIKLIPFQFTAPKVTGAKAECLITLDTAIGSVKKTDTFLCGDWKISQRTHDGYPHSSWPAVNRFAETIATRGGWVPLCFGMVQPRSPASSSIGR